jgi:hypothetical protein
VALSIRTGRPFAELIELDDELLETYFDVITGADREAKDGQ